MLACVLRGIAFSIATQVQPLTTPVCALAGGPDRTHCCDDCVHGRRGGYLASPGANVSDRLHQTPATSPPTIDDSQ
jgi:hypothetical protein